MNAIARSVLVLWCFAGSCLRASAADPPAPVRSVLGEGAIAARAFDAAGNELKDAIVVSRDPIVALGGGETITLRVAGTTQAIARVVLFERRPIEFSIGQDETRAMRFDPAPRWATPCSVATATLPIVSARLLALARADRSSALVLAGEGATIRIDAGPDSRALLSVEIVPPAMRRSDESATPLLATISWVAADDALAAIELLRSRSNMDRVGDGGLPLAAIDARNAPPGYVLARRIEFDRGAPRIVESVLLGAAGRPLDLFRGDGVPSLWASLRSAPAVRAIVVDATEEPQVVSLEAGDLGLGSNGFVLRDGESKDELGRGRAAIGFPIGAGSRRLLELSPLAPGAAPEEPSIVLVHGPSPLQRFAVEKVGAGEAGLSTRVLAALHENGIVFVGLHGAGDLTGVPPEIASLMIPTIAPYRGTRRSEALRGGAERVAEHASNVLWALGIPTQPIEARDWLVCLEAGFYATPLQPRQVDGMPAARGFAVFMNPGLVVVTIGLSEAELNALADGVADPKKANDALAKVVEAQQAVRLARAPTGLFDGLSRYPRWTTDDFVPGDPIVMMRWAALTTGSSRRRLRSLPLKSGGPAIPEDVYEFTSPVQFALDLPHPFVQPVVAVLRTVGDDSADVLLTYDERPLDRIARTKGERGLWREEIWLMRPEMTSGQVRVALALEPQGGVGRVARVGFFASRRDEGIPLSLLVPSGIAPGTTAVGLAHRLDGTPIVDREEAQFNGMEIATDAAVSFALPAGIPCKRLEFTATAPSDSARDGGGWLLVRADGVDKARYEIAPKDREPLSAKLDIAGARELEFRVEARGPSNGSVLVLDPRAR